MNNHNIVVGLLILVAACVPQQAENIDPPVEDPMMPDSTGQRAFTNVDVRRYVLPARAHDMWNTHARTVFEFHLDDGTHCVTRINFIDCDWENDDE